MNKESITTRLCSTTQVQARSMQTGIRSPFVDVDKSGERILWRIVRVSMETEALRQSLLRGIAARGLCLAALCESCLGVPHLAK